MTKRAPANIAASVRARLGNIARNRKVEMQLILSEFAIERLLYRLGASAHAEGFVLKGATLFRLWTGEIHRATWDLDLLGCGAEGVEAVVSVMRKLCAMPGQDGIEFDLASICGEEIRALDEYGGVRVRLLARLGETRIPVQVDVGFGDAVTPRPSWQTCPTLLGHAPPRILVYPRETVVAEKLEAMVSLGVTNSRMKDFYDMHVLASSFEFEGPTVVAAIRATFARRGTELPEAEPIVLTRAFLDAPERRTLWRAFLRRSRLDAPLDAGAVADALMRFLGPVLTAAASGDAFRRRWTPGGPWSGVIS